MDFWFPNAGIDLNNPVQDEEYDQHNTEGTTGHARKEDVGQQHNAEETTGHGEQATGNVSMSGMNAGV
jgi:hypothetical protein